MDIYEARALFKAISSELLSFIKKAYEPTDLTFCTKSNRVGRVREFFEKRKWVDGYYVSKITAWKLPSRYNEDCHRVVKYLSGKNQYVIQERCYRGDDLKFRTNLIDLNTDNVDVLSEACKELLVYAMNFGLDFEKFEVWYKQVNEPMPNIRTYLFASTKPQ